MKTRFAVSLAILVLVNGLMFSNSALGSVEATITLNDVHAVVRDNGVTVNEHYTDTTIPANFLLEAATGDYYSNVLIDYSKSGGQTVLSYDTDQNRSGTQYDYASAIDKRLKFTVDTDTTYALSGWYDVTDNASERDPSRKRSGEVRLLAQLYDLDTSDVLFESYQRSNSTIDESFALGGTGGDLTNTLKGSSTGILLAGHEYQITWDQRTYALHGSDYGASALGHFEVVIGTVPEPTTLAVWSLLGLTAVGISKKRKIKA